MHTSKKAYHGSPALIRLAWLGPEAPLAAIPARPLSVTSPGHLSDPMPLIIDLGTRPAYLIGASDHSSSATGND
jgi:hypothetical protein